MEDRSYGEDGWDRWRRACPAADSDPVDSMMLSGPKIGACPELPTAAIIVTSTVTDSDESARADGPMLAPSAGTNMAGI